MAGNSFKMGETVCFEAELEGVNSSISDVDIEISDSITGTYAISGTQMEELGNQKFRYFWDTRVGYSGTSGWSSYSAYVVSGVVVYSGWSGTSGYSEAVSGLYNCKISARDANDHYGYEEFRIRIG